MSSLSQPEKKTKRKSIDPEDSFYTQPNGVLLDEKQWLYIQKRYHMSPRELQVAKLICQGLTNGDVAKKLKVRPGTVKTHLRSIFGKTRARNKITLLLRFIDDISEFFHEYESTVPIPIMNREEPSKKTPAPWGDT